MPSAGFEPQMYALDVMATGIGEHTFWINNLFYERRLTTGWMVWDRVGWP